MTGLRQALLECGKDLTSSVREAVLAAGQPAVPMLLELLRDAELAEADDADETDDIDELEEMDGLDENEETEEADATSDGWTPIHAAVLLGELRAPEAVEPLLAAYEDSDWDDYLKDRSLTALHQIGAPALEATLRALESAADDEQRDDLCAVLGGLGVRDERAFSHLLAELSRDPERGATDLSCYGDARALPLLLEALDRHEVEVGNLGTDQTLIELAAAVERLGGKLHPEHEAKLARMDELRLAAGRPRRVRGVASLSEVGRLLAQSVEELDPAAREAILSKGGEAVPALIEVLVDPALEEEDSPGEGWAPCHAAALLGELRAPGAALPLIATFIKSDREDYLKDAAALALKKLGALALEASLQAFDAADEDELDEFVILLAGLGVRDDRILQRLLTQLALDTENVPDQLVNYGDPRAVPALIAELDRYSPKVTREDLMDPAFPALVNAVRDLGGQVPPKHEARFEKLRRLYRETGALAMAADSLQAPAVRRERPGRNDPCWCGSSKKYKKCHLEEDETGAR